MVGQRFVIALLVGVLLALPYVWWAQRARRPELPFAIGLVVAALIYVLFAAVAGQSHSLLLELAGLALFGVLAFVGARWLPMLLAVGWVVHVGWDLLLHPVEASTHAPWWYPVLCTSFDLFVAGFIAATYWGNGTDRSATV